MIPQFSQPSLDLGPLTIHAFGVLVAVAVLFGLRMVRTRAARVGLDPFLAERLVGWILIGGFAGAHLVDRFVYYPEQTLADPISILKFWQGLSSFGGFLGAIAGATIFIRRNKIPANAWRYLDTVAYAFPFGWIFGRTGCFLAFDHPGKATDFVLGHMYRDDVVRHNLGLYEALYTVVIAAIFYLLGRKGDRPAGYFLGLLAVLYAPVRFLLDFLRRDDVRYAGLTPGQWGSLLLLLVGLFIFQRAFRRRLEKTGQPAPVRKTKT